MTATSADDHLGRQLLSAVLGCRAQRAALVQIEIAWPDSRALLQRLALGLSACHRHPARVRQRLALMVTNAIEAHHQAKAAGRSDRDRFRAFIDGITATLEADEHRALALALTHDQRRVLAPTLRSVPSPAPSHHA